MTQYNSLKCLKTEEFLVQLVTIIKMRSIINYFYQKILNIFILKLYVDFFVQAYFEAYNI